MERRFKVRAQVSTDDPEAVEPVLRRLLGMAGYRVVADGFAIDAELGGENARELNRRILSELRHACRRTRIRAVYSHEGTSEQFFDYSFRSRSR